MPYHSFCAVFPQPFNLYPFLCFHRRSDYFLFPCTGANRESLGAGKPQPSVHKIVPLGVDLVPLRMSCEDIVRIMSGSQQQVCEQ